MIIEKSLDSKKILKINNNGKNVYLGSKYNMNREISNFREKFSSINKNYGVIIFGSAGGEWLEDFKEEFNGRNIIFIEPLDKLKVELEETIKNFDISVDILSLEDIDLRDKLKKFMIKRFTEFVIFSNYDLIFPKNVYDFRQLVREIVIDKTLNENTIITFAQDWFKNYLGNLPYALECENLNQYKNKYSNKPAIIVSAGPSLEKNIDLLKGNEDKFIIITGIRTLSTLKKKGIKADFACVIDGSEEMYAVSKESLDYNTPLFFSEGANRKIINDYKGKKIYFSSPTFLSVTRHLGRFGTDILFQGGSVAHSCTAIAYYLGCNPIIFIGQDLAFTNNQIHAKSATIEGEELHIEEHEMYVKDINGNDIGTSYSFDTFRKSFERFISTHDDRNYINATEGGANIHGTEIKTLKVVIDKYNERIDKTYIDEVKEVNPDINIVLNNLNNNLKEIIKIKKFANEAILENKNLLNKFLNNNKQFKESLKTLDYIDEKFGQKQREFLLMNSLFAPIIKEIDLAFYDEKVGNFESEIEHIQFISEKGKAIYENINKNIEFAIPYMEETVNKLEGLINESR